MVCPVIWVANSVIHPLEVGTPVFVIKEYPLSEGKKAPDCRRGRIVEHQPQHGGYLVKHDEAEDMGPFGLVDTFGWGYDEVIPVE